MLSRTLFVASATACLLIGAVVGSLYTLRVAGLSAGEWWPVGNWPKYPRTQLKVVGAWGNLTQYKNFEHPFWTQRIPGDSRGAVTADVSPFDEMGLSAKEILGLLKGGAIDFGSVVLGYLAGDDARNEAADLAGLAPDALIARKIVDSYRPVYEKLYRDKYGVQVLGIWPYSAQVLFCNGPINSLSDLKGKRVRTASRSMAQFVEALGGSGVELSFSDVVPALREKRLDCAITGALSGNSAKWHEVTTHLHMLPLGWSLVLHGASIKTWARLDPKLREFLKSEVATLEDDIWRSAAVETQEGFDCNAGKDTCKSGIKGNMTLVEVTSTERVVRRYALTEAVLPGWAARCRDCVADWNDTVGKTVGMVIGESALQPAERSR